MRRYLHFMPEASSQQLAYARELFNLIINDREMDKVTVSSGRCGLGKSTFVQALISWLTQDDRYKFRGKNCIPIIVVTDLLDRLKGYQDGEKDPPKDILSHYYESHKKYCAYISSEDTDKGRSAINDQLVRALYRPIVLLSTQRYFGMPDEQRERLFEYRYGQPPRQKVYRRELVIFDEKPYLHDTVSITIKRINDTDTALRCGIPRDNKDKDWILYEYGQWRDKTTSLLRDRERNCKQENTDIFFWKEPNTSNLTSNDEQFFNLIGKYKSQISTDFPDAIPDLKRFKRLMTDGAFFFSIKRQRDGEYSTHFQLIQDNREKFYIGQGQAKFFVLDGTADIDPEYQHDYLSLIDSSANNIPLNLTIELR